MLLFNVWLEVLVSFSLQYTVLFIIQTDVFRFMKRFLFFIFGKQSQINLQSYLTKQTAFMPSLWESSVFFAKERNELV